MLVVLCPGLGAPASEAADARAQQVKAAIVLNIARFVVWPGDSFQDHEDSVYLCLYRENSLGGALAGIQGKKIGGRRLHTRTVASLADSTGCNVMFVPHSVLDVWENDSPESAAPIGPKTPISATKGVPPCSPCSGTGAAWASKSICAR